jgi:hypothetical protein
VSNGDVFRVTLKHAYTDVGVAVQHVLWFRQTSDDPGSGESLLLGAIVSDQWTTGGNNGAPTWLWSPDFQHQGWEAQKMLDPIEAPVSGSDTTGGAGDDPAFAGIPSVCSMVVTLLSARGGRRGRGRIYLGGFASRRPNNPGFWSEAAALAEHGHWSGAFGSDVISWLVAFRDRFDGVTVIDEDSGFKAEWGVWSRVLGNQTAPHDPDGFSPIVAISTDEVVRIQRRREYGHGI